MLYSNMYMLLNSENIATRFRYTLALLVSNRDHTGFVGLLNLEKLFYEGDHRPMS